MENLTDFPFVKQRTPRIPYSWAKQRKALPLQENEEGVLVALTDPRQLETIEELQWILKKTVEPFLASPESIDRAIELCYRQKEGETQKLVGGVISDAGTEEIEEIDLLDPKEENPVVRLVHAILLEAIQQGSSDIHFEPSDEGMLVRYRIDGVLYLRHRPAKGIEGQLVARIKVMAKLDIAEHRLPQDGRIKLLFGGREIDFRVSTLPTVYGERVVLRILDRGNVLLGLDQIGMSESLLKGFRKLIRSSEGIVLVTGPTGSGKTTTLYSALSEIISDEINIITVEDPVEYKLKGISQIHVNPKIQLDFARGLRHILRQDPDVIMIGEIRDQETAEIAIQASLTGHLVLSTLHTNDAPSALTRLSDMGIEPYLLASSILGVVAQRLVRKICPSCKISYHPSDEERREMGVGNPEVRFWKGKGCSDCYATGYRGRIGLYELMVMTSQIKAQVLKSQDSELLRKTAAGQGFISLFALGVEKVLAGETTSAEVLRVTRMAEG